MLTEAEVREIALPILRSRLSSEGLSEVKIVFENDFDDEPIIRIEANLERPTRQFDRIRASANDIREAISGRGDTRFVFIRQASPDEDAAAFDEEDEPGEVFRQ